ncbi:MAG: deaminase, partial [Flavobacteriales bacterium]
MAEEITTEIDEKYMRMAMREAMHAYDADEVHIGCVILCKGQFSARGYNLTVRLQDFTENAE